MARKKSKERPAASKKPAGKASPPAAALIEPGKAAPAFRLVDQSGDVRQLKDRRGRWVVLYFYPKDNTPGCTKQACSFRDVSAELEKRDAVVLGVSPDDESSHEKFARKFDLPFPLLADTDQAVCRKYGVWQQKSMYGRAFMGVVRTTYLIDPAGKVARRWDRVKVAKHDADVLAALDECIK